MLQYIAGVEIADSFERSRRDSNGVLSPGSWAMHHHQIVFPQGCIKPILTLLEVLDKDA